MNRDYRAYLDVQAKGFIDGEVRVCYRIGKERASEPSLLLLLKNDDCIRLDVNGDHREGTRMYYGVTHVQRTRESGERAEFDLNLPGHVPQVVRGEHVSGETYRQLLRYFAEELCSLDVSGVRWVDPPEGRQP